MKRTITLVFIAIGAILQAQTNENSKDQTVLSEDSISLTQNEIGAFRITPYITPLYTPETKLMLAAGGLLSFSIQKNNTHLNRSSIGLIAGYSVNSSLFIAMRSTLYGRRDRTRYYTDIWIKNMPDDYWGVGFDNGKYVPQSDSTTAYHRKWYKINQKTSIRLNETMFVGFAVDFSGTTATDLNPRMANDTYIVQQGSSIRNAGFGVMYQYDTRNFVQNAYSGMLVETAYTHYDNLFGGQSKFDIIDIDLRQFIPIHRERRTLALQCKSRFGLGDVPWSELSQIGTPFDLRGYYWGRYRDNNYLFGIAEYRHMFLRTTPNKKGSMNSRLGFIVWGGLGTVASDLNDYQDWLPNYGAGLRVELQPKLNLRVDYGFGNDTKALYFTLNETF